MRPENILLVDDNELLLSGMKRFFERDFEHVAACTTGEEALIKISQRPYHAVILDLNLPGVSGWEVLNCIKQTAPTTRVIIITSSDDSRVRQNAIGRGASECLGKPFNIDELKCILVNVLSIQRHQRIQKSFPVKFNDDCRGIVCNLSPSGLFILTDSFCECGTSLQIDLKTPEEDAIPLKGLVVRTVEPTLKSYPAAPAEWNPPEDMKYGLGIKLTEQHPVYTSLVNSLLL